MHDGGFFFFLLFIFCLGRFSSLALKTLDDRFQRTKCADRCALLSLKFKLVMNSKEQNQLFLSGVSCRISHRNGVAIASGYVSVCFVLRHN